MYNMDITILGYKFNLEILILIGVVYLILVGHTVCGCCNMPRIMEGISNMTSSDSSSSDSANSDDIKKMAMLKQQQQQK
jgi:hypothetical protein